MMFIKVFCVILLSATLLQAEPSESDEAWKVYQEMKSTIVNATLQGLQRLQDLHEDNVVPSVRKVLEVVESDMTDTYFYKQDKMDSIAKVARDKGVNISKCLHDNQEHWLTVWQTQMLATSKVSSQALEQIEKIVSQVRTKIRGSLEPVFDEAAAIDNCTTLPHEKEGCFELVIYRMDSYMHQADATIDSLVNGVEGVVVPVFTYMYLALINVSTQQAIEGRNAIANVTACTHVKQQ